MKKTFTLAETSICLILLAACTGCNCFKKLQAPDALFVEANRQAYEFIGPRFLTYVQADPTLSAVDKGLTVQAVSDWEFMIRTAEESVAADPVPADGFFLGGTSE
tara:strand:- start:6426 stop:6740 length:315 start_codon:yes stop_codon:yes gene_type:complete